MVKKGRAQRQQESSQSRSRVRRESKSKSGDRLDNADLLSSMRKRIGDSQKTIIDKLDTSVANINNQIADHDIILNSIQRDMLSHQEQIKKQNRTIAELSSQEIKGATHVVARRAKEMRWSDRAGSDLPHAGLMRQSLQARETSARAEAVGSNGDARVARQVARIWRMPLAWKRSGRQNFPRQVTDVDGVRLYALRRELVESQSMPADFRASAAAFPPNGQPFEGEVVARIPGGTRPLPLSNADTKLSSASIAWPLSQITNDMVQGPQKGALTGRQMIDNIIGLYANLVIANSLCDQKRAGSALFDLKAAFPSIMHEYTWIVFHSYGALESHEEASNRDEILEHARLLRKFGLDGSEGAGGPADADAAAAERGAPWEAPSGGGCPARAPLRPSGGGLRAAAAGGFHRGAGCAAQGRGSRWRARQPAAVRAARRAGRGGGAPARGTGGGRGARAARGPAGHRRVHPSGHLRAAARVPGRRAVGPRGPRRGLQRTEFEQMTSPLEDRWRPKN
ncbi:unnamed protein product [Prorocentrum cordatum]|uniref:t-SNARE coiled-coil homology domain-containing protein n=1 Tax=Prorocentrum cordatum TaxID=2364126 RepID=A0ABN9XYN7_9DINO|nr:unnamed protein product [Polarella glacialis]